MIDVDLSPSSAAPHARAHSTASGPAQDAAEDEPVASPATVQRRRAIEDALDCVDQRRAKGSAARTAGGTAKAGFAAHGRARAAAIIDDDEDEGASKQTPSA